jgi:preprotein translocase subunit SecG
MGTILLVVYITAAISMIVLILLQRSEGGALGMGGGGGGLVTGRGAANFLTRTTAILAAIFFLAAIGLGMLGHRAQPSSAVVGAPAKAPAGGSTRASEGAPVEKTPSSLPELKLPKLKPETAPSQSSSGTAPAPAPTTPALPQPPQSQ